MYEEINVDGAQEIVDRWNKANPGKAVAKVLYYPMKAAAMYGTSLDTADIEYYTDGLFEPIAN